MDIRQAAEQRAEQLRLQNELFQREKERHMSRHRTSSAPMMPKDFNGLTNDDINPENKIEVNETSENNQITPFDPISSVITSSSHISPYKETNQRYSLKRQVEQQRQSVRMAAFVDNTPLKESLTEMYLDNILQDNVTPRLAKLAASEYKLNGARARANSGEYIRPRWIPDEAMEYCLLCSTSFTVMNRRHHCRYCGNLVCDSCSLHKALLPIEFGLRDPQRICNPCYEVLSPLQSSLINHLANHERENEIQPIVDPDVASCQIRRYSNLPFSLTLGSEIRKAAYSVYNLFNLNYLQDKTIPLWLLERAQGIAFLTVAKAGFIFAPKIGTGLVISRLSSPSTASNDVRWSAPSAIGTIGVSCGLVLGVDVTDYVIILNTTEAVEAFCSSGQVTLGGSVDIAVGPVGRSGSGDVHISANGLASAYSYSHSRGMFAGVSLDGAVIMPRPNVNSNFYGRTVTTADLLHGQVPPPRAAKPLYLALQEALSATPSVEHHGPSPAMKKLTNLAVSNPCPEPTPSMSQHIRQRNITRSDEEEVKESDVIDLQQSRKNY